MTTHRFATSLLLAAAAVFTFSSCSTEDHEDILGNWKWDNGSTPAPDPEPEPEPEPTEANPKVVAQGWENVTAQFGELPEHINVYKKTTTSDGAPAIAYIAVADMSKATFDVASDLAKDETGNFACKSLYTPSEFYEANDKPAIVINGGLFFESDGLYYSQSALYRNGEMLSSNQTYWTLWDGNFWYPTLGFFFQDKDGNYQAKWSYYSWTGNDYLYDEPRQCDPEKPEQDLGSPSPSSVVLNDGQMVKVGIGGVGVLVHDGVPVNTWQYEMMDVSGGSNQPRTAIGYSKTDNRLVFFVCEGRGMTEGVAGMTIDEVSVQMSAIGCTEALCLDGGGSSCMLVNGKETIKGSDGTQRKVIDACLLK